jgi:hypothetical protein
MSSIVYSFHWVRITHDENEKTAAESTESTPADNSTQSTNTQDSSTNSTYEPTNK